MANSRSNQPIFFINLPKDVMSYTMASMLWTKDRAALSITAKDPKHWMDEKDNMDALAEINDLKELLNLSDDNEIENTVPKKHYQELLKKHKMFLYNAYIENKVIESKKSERYAKHICNADPNLAALVLIRLISKINYRSERTFLIAELINAKANVDHVHGEHGTSLMAVVTKDNMYYEDRIQIVKALLEARANPAIPKNGLTPLDIVKSQHVHEICELLEAALHDEKRPRIV